MIVYRESGTVTTAGWQVTMCDPIWHVISRTGEVRSQTAIIRTFTFTFTSQKYPLKFSLCFYMSMAQNSKHAMCINDIDTQYIGKVGRESVLWS